MAINPYENQPKHAFWRPAIADRHCADLENLWEPMDLKRVDKVATAGSCFAQHIGNNLVKRGANYMDMEPAPPIFETLAEAREWGFGVFSCRYGNIYTTRQLVQLFDEAFGRRTPVEQVWTKGARFIDALRPSVDPVGQDNAVAVLKLRAVHLAAVRKMFETLDLFVFTLGLTEGWEHREDGTMFPMAPGTLAGSYDPDKYVFHNLRYAEILNDLLQFRERLMSVNAAAQILLTVSPVPLTATATDSHVLLASVYSKSVLRGVAGEMAEDFDNVTYFPSYEIISSHPSGGMFFNRDQRTVNALGVDYVMSHFFSGRLADQFESENDSAPNEEIDLICDEDKL
jgi:hypothetical protein